MLPRHDLSAAVLTSAKACCDEKHTEHEGEGQSTETRKCWRGETKKDRDNDKKGKDKDATRDTEETRDKKDRDKDKKGTDKRQKRRGQNRDSNAFQTRLDSNAFQTRLNPSVMKPQQEFLPRTPKTPVPGPVGNRTPVPARARPLFPGTR